MDEAVSLFPSFSLSPTTRQTTRALQEIQAQRPGLLYIDGEGLAVAPVPVEPSDITDRVRWSVNLASSFDTPSPSPDELAILARGRRRVPLTYSPDLISSPISRHLASSPTSRHQVARARLATLNGPQGRLLLGPHHRTSPRKRLTLSDSPPGPGSPSPDKASCHLSPLAKRLRPCPESQLTTMARGLAQPQLVALLSTLLDHHPALAQEVAAIMPLPDLATVEENLNYLKRNIYKALPSTRLESKTDSMAYNRVSVHLVAFKKALLEQLKVLLDSHHWLSTIDFVVMAWNMVKATPVWSNPSHNTVRKTCFKQLAAGCMRALREASLGAGQCREVRTKLERLKSEADEMLVCLKYLDFIISNGDTQ